MVFLSADYLDQPYSICPQEPQIDPAGLDALREQPGFQRVPGIASGRYPELVQE